MNAGGKTFSATSRSSLVSRARHTSPMPPSPILAVTVYGPRVVPGSKGMLLSGGQPERVAGEHIEFASFGGIDQLGDLTLHDIASL